MLFAICMSLGLATAFGLMLWGLLVYLPEFERLYFKAYDAFRRWRSRRAVDDWHCVAYGGGSAVWIRATRSLAIEYCSKNFGVVAYVDDNIKHIFYKPAGWTGSGYPGTTGM